MEYSFYCVYDKKLKRYNVPFVARNDDEAVVILLRSGIPKSIYNDAKLFKVSSFCDDVVGKKNPMVSSEFIDIKLPPFPQGGDQNG